jgi:hypothetical protein
MDLKAREDIPETYKEWFRADLRHAEIWRKEAKIDFDFRDNDQWTEDEKLKLQSENRPDTQFNRILTIVDAVSGQEIANRLEVRYLPRKQTDPNDPSSGKPSELLTEAGRWARDKADADDNDSEAFRDTLTCGMGWTETRLDHEENPDGDLKDDRINPFEMLWDCNATKRNLIDSRRFWHVRRLPIVEARELAPGFDDAELNAAWADTAVWDGGDPHNATKIRDRSRSNLGEAGGDLDEAVIVHCQWVEVETYWSVPIPGAGRRPFKPNEYKAFKKQFAERMMGGEEPTDEQLGAVKQRKKVRYRALLGNKVLVVTPTACPDHFNFKCITGKRHQTKNQWFGLVRAMRDPQSWSNKFFSQILHIINSNAKGGIFAERGQAFDNDADAQETYARSDRITWMKPGALSGQNAKWAEKPQTQFPQGLQFMMQYAADAVRETGGVSYELLGQQETDQAASLEYQRRQAGLTILAPLFDSLKAYRREQGELILWYIQNDLSDGRLIRVLGKDNAQYLPLVKQETLEYDLIVDDMPTSPNQKEMSWAIIKETMPILASAGMSPETLLMLLEDSPLNSTVLEKLKGRAKDQMQQQQPMMELQQRMAQIEAMLNQAKIGQVQADTELKKAQAVAELKDAPNPEAEFQLKALETSGHIQVKQAEAQANIQVAQQKAASDIQVAQTKAAVDMQVQQQKHWNDQQMAAERHHVDMATAHQQMALTADQHQHDVATSTAKTSADIANKDRVAKAAAKRKPAK